MFTLPQALEAIKDKTEFSVKDKGSYTVIDYNLNTKITFVGKDEKETKILLNLRGTAFDNETGKIIRLGYHKFFNYGEFPESDKLLDFSDVLITQKLDGSCIYPLYTREGIKLGTRAGVTDVSKLADEYLETSGNISKYSSFIDHCRTWSNTPIFEYCSRENRVVINHPEPMLVLTGVRNMITGKYLERKNLELFGKDFDIPVVRVYSTLVQDIDAYLEEIANLKDDEGVVIKFPNDHMVKVKASEYVLRHKAVDQLQFEKDAILLHLNGLLDDIYPILDATLANQIQTYSERLNHAIFSCLDEIHAEFFKFKHLTGDRKEFALAVKDNKYKQFLFKLCSDAEFDVSDMLFEQCRKNCSTQASTKELKLFLNFHEIY
jgi:RNA ligase